MNDEPAVSGAIPLQPIGIVRSPYREKFGIPRQPGLVPLVRARLELLPPYDRPEALQGLEDFSHLWIIFLFHGCQNRGWRPTVRPPRLGGNQRVGVFASRATHRPNPLGLSRVTLEQIHPRQLEISGHDLLDGTPILDIKPYLPWADGGANGENGARAGFATTPPEHSLSIRFSPRAEQQLTRQAPELRGIIQQLLTQDPRPAYRRGRPDPRAYGMTLYDFDLRWRVEGQEILVLGLEDKQS